MNTMNKLNATAQPFYPSGLNVNARPFYPSGLNPYARSFYPHGIVWWIPYNRLYPVIPPPPSPSPSPSLQPSRQPSQVFTFDDAELDFYFLNH